MIVQAAQKLEHKYVAPVSLSSGTMSIKVLACPERVKDGGSRHTPIVNPGARHNYRVGSRYNDFGSFLWIESSCPSISSDNVHKIVKVFYYIRVVTS